MDRPEISSERRARGLDVYRQVYGNDAFAFEPGQVEFFDLMMADLFGDIWARPTLPIATRRLLVMGVLAAQHRFDTLGMQFRRTLEAGELSVDQVREVVIQLLPYVGYSCSSDLYQVSESAISSHVETGE